MTEVICVRFRTAGKIYYFSPGNLKVKRGDNVIVETARGVEFGKVVSDIKEVEDKKVVQPLKKIMRVATDEDKETEKKNREKEKDAFAICLEKVYKHKLDIHLTGISCFFILRPMAEWISESW